MLQLLSVRISLNSLTSLHKPLPPHFTCRSNLLHLHILSPFIHLPLSQNFYKNKDPRMSDQTDGKEDIMGGNRNVLLRNRHNTGEQRCYLNCIGGIFSLLPILHTIQLLCHIKKRECNFVFLCLL